jgi:hypothetical protein
VAIGDVNGDGKPDLAVSNQASANVSVLLNNGPSIGISPQPQSQSVVPGANVVFTATATGTGPFTYHWRRNGLPISGATTGTLTINNVSEASVGSYDVQVRGGCNPAAVATSYPAVLSMGGSGGCVADLGVQGGIPGRDNLLDNNDFIVFIDAFFNQTGCP